MARDVLQAGQRWPGKKRRGKRFLSFCRDTLVGNPGDPLIGFPIVFNHRELATENRELVLEITVASARTLSAHRAQPVYIAYRFLHRDSITKDDSPA